MPCWSRHLAPGASQPLVGDSIWVNAVAADVDGGHSVGSVGVKTVVVAEAAHSRLAELVQDLRPRFPARDQAGYAVGCKRT